MVAGSGRHPAAAAGPSGGARGTDFAGRLGGEEFAALIADTTEGSALVVAERLREEIANLRVATPRGDIRFSASIGHAIAQPGDRLADVLARADRALYVSKESGRNRVTCAQDLATSFLSPGLSGCATVAA